jgi:hypothetical protein
MARGAALVRAGSERQVEPIVAASRARRIGAVTQLLLVKNARAAGPQNRPTSMLLSAESVAFAT